MYLTYPKLKITKLEVNIVSIRFSTDLSGDVIVVRVDGGGRGEAQLREQRVRAQD